MEYRIYVADEVDEGQSFIPITETFGYEGNHKGLKRNCEGIAESVYNSFGESRNVYAYEAGSLDNMVPEMNGAPVFQVRYSPENGGTFSVPEVFA